MKIQLCACADEYSVSLDRQIEGLKKFNIPYIELRGIDDKNVSVCTPEEAKLWKEKFDKNGIKVWAIGSPVGKVQLHLPFEEHLEMVENLCKIANVLECDKIRGFSFYTPDREGNKELVVERLKQIIAVTKKYGIELYHENEKGIFGENVKWCKYLLDQIPELKCVYDPANFIQSKVDVKEALEVLQGRVDYYHIKDAYYSDGAVVPAGKGDGMLEDLVKGIDKDTVLTLEPHLTVFSGYNKIDKTELKTHYRYPTSEDAFVDAVKAIKEILTNQGYNEEGKVWTK